METPGLISLSNGCIDLRQQRVLGRGKFSTSRAQSASYWPIYQRMRDKRFLERDLLVDVWDYSPTSLTRAVDNMIRKVRSKLEQDPRKPKHIFTVHGEGYRFEPAVDARCRSCSHLRSIPMLLEQMLTIQVSLLLVGESS